MALALGASTSLVLDVASKVLNQLLNKTPGSSIFAQNKSCHLRRFPLQSPLVHLSLSICSPLFSQNPNSYHYRRLDNLSVNYNISKDSLY